jgi:hypothetical protein
VAGSEPPSKGHTSQQSGAQIVSPTKFLNSESVPVQQGTNAAPVPSMDGVDVVGTDSTESKPVAESAAGCEDTGACAGKGWSTAPCWLGLARVFPGGLCTGLAAGVLGLASDNDDPPPELGEAKDTGTLISSMVRPSKVLVDA